MAANPDVRLVPAPPPTRSALPFPEAVPVTRSSHSAAAAWAAKCVGAALPGETDTELEALAWVYVRQCPTCADGEAALWDVAGGLRRLLEDRGKACRVVQLFRVADSAADRIVPAQLAEALAEGHAIVATICYEHAAGIPPVAAQRRGACISVGVVGCAQVAGQWYLVARDGLAPEAAQKGGHDRLTPADVDGPWGDACDRPGTALYRWEGANANVVVVLASSLTR